MSEKTHKCELKRHSLDEILDEFDTGLGGPLGKAWQKQLVASGTHPLCTKFFKSESTIHSEIKRQLSSGYHYIIHPLSKFRIRYEIYLVVLYSFAIFMGPIESAFSRKTKKYFMKNYYPFQTVIDILCQLDVIINFFTGYMVKNTRNIELRPSKIFKNYTFGYFLFDFLSAIPRHLLYYSFPPPYPPTVLLGIWNILRLLKFPRIFTLFKIMKRVYSYFNVKSTTLYSISLLIVGISYGIHLFGCLQYLFPRITHSYFTSSGVYSSAWIYNYDFRYLKELYKYFHSVFRASAYLLGIRLNQIYSIVILPDYIMYGLTAVLGKIILAILWVTLAVSILNSRSLEIKYEELITQLNEYMAQKRLPPALRERMLDYYKFKYQKKYLKEEMIIGLLSENLKKQVNIASFKSLISKVTLFAELTPDQLSHIISKLTSEIFLPTDMIVQSGTMNTAMYFIASGTVAVFTHSGKELCHLTDGAHFGEISLVIKGQTSIANIIALETSEVFKLEKKHFDKILMKNKSVYRIITTNAEKRLKEAMEAEEDYRRKLFEQTYRR